MYVYSWSVEYLADIAATMGMPGCDCCAPTLRDTETGERVGVVRDTLGNTVYLAAQRVQG